MPTVKPLPLSYRLGKKFSATIIRFVKIAGIPAAALAFAWQILPQEVKNFNCLEFLYGVLVVLAISATTCSAVVVIAMLVSFAMGPLRVQTTKEQKEIKHIVDKGILVQIGLLLLTLLFQSMDRNITHQILYELFLKMQAVLITVQAPLMIGYNLVNRRA